MLIAVFEKSFNKIINIYEGGYSNDPDDPGGETYRGIARNANPDWLGWEYVDLHKNDLTFPRILEKNISLKALVMELYKEKYWDKFKGDELDESTAMEMFDQAVNFGVVAAIRHLQRTINVLNNKQKLYPNILIDGFMGDETLNAYKMCVEKRSCKLIFNVLNYFQGMRYLHLMETDEVKEKYVGWFNRIEVLR